jgi:exodeoxyribonuclease VII small subunit
MAKKQLNYADAVAEIEKISALLEKGDVSVDELTAHIKRATVLIQWCRGRLRSTQEEIDNALDSLEE